MFLRYPSPLSLMRFLKSWLLSVFAYQRGIALTARETSFKRLMWWRFTVLTLIFSVWSGYTFADLPVESPAEYGIKAAICALGTTACVLVELLPVPTENRRFRYLGRLYGSYFAILTGVFWLLEATEGQPWSYLRGRLDIVVALLITSLLVGLVVDMYRWESLYIKVRQQFRSHAPGHEIEVQCDKDE